jgi:hypothetical protein
LHQRGRVARGVACGVELGAHSECGVLVHQARLLRAGQGMRGKRARLR